MARRNEVVTGVFVLLGIAVVIVAGIWMSEGRWGAQGTVLTARFRAVGQLRPGNPVSYRGVTIGAVEAVRLADDGTVAVDMRLRPEAPVIAEPVALIQPSSLFGDWQAALYPAAERPDIAGDTVGLLPGVIPGSSLAEFSELSEHTAEIAANLRGITERLEIALNDQSAAEVSGAIRNVNLATEELLGLLRDQRTSLDRLAGDVAEAGGTIREASSSLQGTMSRLDSATAGGRLDRMFTDAEASVANMQEVTAEWREAGRRLNTTLSRADSTLTEAGEALARVNRGEGTLGRLSSDEVLYENTAATLEELRSLLDDLKTNPGKYFHFSVF
ncbi:MAG: MCE family protein [Gemmatimonadales bacterium]|nr:MAG: MCE family protein [Gemmatimonadales bacterium]